MVENDDLIRESQRLLMEVNSVLGDSDNWITPKEAVNALENINQRKVYRMLGEFLVYRRPLPARVEISRYSVLDLRQAMNDPAFWDSPALQKPVKDSVLLAMKKLVASSLQGR